MAWTESQFKAKLRAEGWENIGQGVYVHKKTGRDFECYGYDKKNECERWRAFAEIEQTPPPF